MSQACAFCGHKYLSARTTRYLHQSGDEMLIVDDAPCLECDFCGGQYFDAAVLKAIEAEHMAIVNHQKTSQALKPVAVESFAAIHG